MCTPLDWKADATEKCLVGRSSCMSVNGNIVALGPKETCRSPARDGFSEYM